MVGAGADAELLAERFLSARGLVPVLRNFHSRFGELDLVMRDRDTLAVVEVRMRSSASHGSAAESVGWHKQRRISQATRHLLGQRPELAELPVRFDVVGVDADGTLDWIRNAFEATE